MSTGLQRPMSSTDLSQSGISVPESSLANTMNTVPESAGAVATRALKAINKSSMAALHLQEVPSELLFGERVDLHRWTMILTDDNLKELSEQSKTEKKYFMDGSKEQMISMFDTFYTPLIHQGLLTLNIALAKNVTDFGITMVARSSPRLQVLNISGTNITDVGLREVGMGCRQLQELDMSNCGEIDGTGLIAVADSCRHLLKFNISRCRKLECWAIKKVFYACTLLEEVVITDMPKVGDEELRVLAQSCPNLASLYCADCPCVSDATVQIVAQLCPDLDLLDLSRTEMMYRISDISLLALAQKSLSLRTLRLSGCDQITDAGLTWLSEGCRVLEELDCCRCVKITDAGLRSLGSGCHSLRLIDISHAKMVTDVGLSSLTKGCAELRHVKFHGVFLLSDPRLSAPTKGAKLEAWQTVIGVAALAQNCPSAESLDLSGCFRLNIALHQYVSSLTHLTTLNLTGCNQCSPEALAAVGRGCRRIETLILSDCGKAVNNMSLQAFASPTLKVFTAQRCTHISGGGIKALSGCRNLVKLDLTGCKTLTDSMLLHLTEADRVPLLRTMILVDVPSLTDSLLAWLSIKSHCILLLAVKGTAISKKALLSVRDRFPNSELAHGRQAGGQGGNFYGFWPKQRVEHRMMINTYRTVIDGLTVIQSRVRKGIAITRVGKIQSEWNRIAAHGLLQRVVRGHLGRLHTYEMRAYHKKVSLSAYTLTSIFHVARAHKAVLRRHQYLRNIARNALASVIQLCWRKHRDRRRLAQKRLARQKWLLKRNFGALKMQSVARIYFARNQVRRIKALRRTRAAVINRKAVVISRVWRGSKARKRADWLREIVRNLQQNRLTAVVRIQRKIRVNRTNRILSLAIYVRHHRLDCVVQVQSVMRGALARIWVAELRTELYQIRRERAIVLLQTRMRMLLARKEVQKRANNRRQMDNSRALAAAVIGGAARVKIARIRYKERKRQHRKKIKEAAQRELHAICKIQSRVRGIAGRVRFELEMRHRKGKWKELYDEKAGKRFFYNKLTGEIRWRIPQELLDLIPKPQCDNCTKCATLECAVCNELFCPLCWEGVHSGGRRRDHEFRALFDFYGRRLDYGDGEYPCKWPSEVMQDEVQGWMLRVAPERHPLRTYRSGWEEYEEPKDRKNLNPKCFYFNRNTFEASYALPREVAEEVEADEAAAQALALEQSQLGSTFLQTSGYYDSGGTWVNTGQWGSTRGGQGQNALVTYPTYPGGQLDPYSESDYGAEYGYSQSQNDYSQNDASGTDDVQAYDPDLQAQWDEYYRQQGIQPPGTQPGGYGVGEDEGQGWQGGEVKQISYEYSEAVTTVNAEEDESDESSDTSVQSSY